jgi:hypothetical protein
MGELAPMGIPLVAEVAAPIATIQTYGQNTVRYDAPTGGGVLAA